MRILVVTQYFYPENFRINTLCRELANRGHEVSVLTGYPQYPAGEIYSGYGFSIPYEKEWNGVRIERVKVHPRGKTFWGLLRNCVDFVIEGNRWAERTKEIYDMVYVFEVSPVTVGLPAVTYKKKKKVPMIFNLQDLWPENVHEVLGIRFPPLTWAIERIVKRIYKASDRILCTSNSFVDHLLKKGVLKEKLLFWPQFCDDPWKKKRQRPNNLTEDYFNIVFAGNLGDAQGLDILIEAMKEFRGQKVRCFLVGEGRAADRLRSKVVAYELQSEVVFVGRVCEEEANNYVAYADFAYLSFANNVLFNMTIPAKMQTYLACGTPILAAAGGESAQIIKESQCGITVQPTEHELKKGIKQILAFSKEQRKQMAANAREYYKQHFRMEDLLDQLEEIMVEITRKGESI